MDNAIDESPPGHRQPVRVSALILATALCLAATLLVLDVFFGTWARQQWTLSLQTVHEWRHGVRLSERSFDPPGFSILLPEGEVRADVSTRKLAAGDFTVRVFDIFDQRVGVAVTVTHTDYGSEPSPQQLAFIFEAVFSEYGAANSGAAQLVERKDLDAGHGGPGQEFVLRHPMQDQAVFTLVQSLARGSALYTIKIAAADLAACRRIAESFRVGKAG